MATIEQLQAELDTLRAELRRMQAGMITAAPNESKTLSRRNLLRVAPVVAVGGALAAMSASPAAAAAGSPVLQGQSNAAGAGTTTGLSGGTPTSDGMHAPQPVDDGAAAALSVSGGVQTDWLLLDGLSVGVAGQAALSVVPSYEGMAAYFQPAQINEVHFEGTGDGVEVSCQGATAVGAYVTDGVHLDEILGGVGVSAAAQSGVAVDASATTGSAITAETTSTTTTTDAVVITYAGASRALYAESTNTTNINGTITGVNDGSGTGVWGEARAAGVGVVGYGGTHGRGAQLSGAVAPLRMVPSTAATHPSTGKAGDFFVDSTARLWYCQKASTSSVAATWKQLA